MKRKRASRVLTLFLCSLVANPIASRGQSSNSGWHPSTTPFHVLAFASEGTSIWACGADEGIAVSEDGGTHWQTKHQTPDGNLLLNLQFVNSKFGYAGGTGGLILTTEDGGETWISRSGPSTTILQISFSDPQHGLIRTPEALEFTSDAGKSWTPVSVPNDPDVLKAFPYTYSLSAIDGDRMAVMLKHGAAQYEPQTFLVTIDGGSPGGLLIFRT